MPTSSRPTTPDGCPMWGLVPADVPFDLEGTVVTVERPAGGGLFLEVRRGRGRPRAYLGARHGGFDEVQVAVGDTVRVWRGGGLGTPALLGLARVRAGSGTPGPALPGPEAPRDAAPEG